MTNSSLDSAEAAAVAAVGLLCGFCALLDFSVGRTRCVRFRSTASLSLCRRLAVASNIPIADCDNDENVDAVGGCDGGKPNPVINGNAGIGLVVVVVVVAAAVAAAVAGVVPGLGSPNTSIAALTLMSLMA